MNFFFLILSVVIRFLLFFTLVRNIARNKFYGWEIRDYTGMGIVGIVLLWGWFSGYGVMRLAVTALLLGTIIAASFEGLDKRQSALVSGICTVAVITMIFLVF